MTFAAAAASIASIAGTVGSGIAAGASAIGSGLGAMGSGIGAGLGEAGAALGLGAEAGGAAATGLGAGGVGSSGLAAGATGGLGASNAAMTAALTPAFESGVGAAVASAPGISGFGAGATQGMLGAMTPGFASGVGGVSSLGLAGLPEGMGAASGAFMPGSLSANTPMGMLHSVDPFAAGGLLGGGDSVTTALKAANSARGLLSPKKDEKAPGAPAAQAPKPSAGQATKFSGLSDPRLVDLPRALGTRKYIRVGG